MSVREEDRSKNCPSRGLGIAAAAIGVGVGAALYYFFNKRSENEHPDSEGSTSNWSCEQPHTLLNRFHEEDDSYSTISEHSTSDTSVHDTTDNVSVNTSLDSDTDFNTSSEMDVDQSDDNRETGPNTSQQDDSLLLGSDDTGSESDSTYISVDSSTNSTSSGDTSLERRSWGDSPGNDSDALPSLNISVERFRDRDSMLLTPSPEPESELETGWDVTMSSVGVPVTENLRPLRPIFHRLLNEIRDIGSKISPRSRTLLTEEEQMAMIRDMEFRERSWSLEECSICFDVMLRDQEVMALQCTHRFHQQCILPWLQEKQTCPNCRKAAECESTLQLLPYK